MNNNENNNIDDILDILQKRKQQDLVNNSINNDVPTRLDTDAIKTGDIENSNHTEEQLTMFEDSTKKLSQQHSVESVSFTANEQKNKVQVDNTKNEQLKRENKNSTPKKTPQTVSSSHSNPAQREPDVERRLASPSSNSAISLDDFSAGESIKKKAQKEKKEFFVPGYVKVIIYLAAVLTVSLVISLNAIKIGNDIFAFVKPDKDYKIVLEDEDVTVKELSQILYDEGVIKYPKIFNWYCNFRIDRRSYLTGKFYEGTTVINSQMNYDQILEALSVIKGSNVVVRVTIPEGYTFDEILELLIQNRVMTRSKIAEYKKQIDEYAYEYNFIDKMPTLSKDRSYRLEGYLFPDTYDFYVGENPVAVIDKLISNFENKFIDKFYTRCDELGYSVDEIITLASIIEKEGDSPENMSKISSVFHNRLKDKSGSFRHLDSDATTLYAYNISGTPKKTLGKGETSLEHPYNTYFINGLPPGPICNPGYEAIYAALYPASTNYKFFLTRADGVTVFANTQAEHNNNIAQSDRIAAQKSSNSEE